MTASNTALMPPWRNVTMAVTLFVASPLATSNAWRPDTVEVWTIGAGTGAAHFDAQGAPGVLQATLSPTASYGDAAQLVRDLHRDSGLTWDQLAQFFGVSRRALHHWAAGGNLTGRNYHILTVLSRRISDLRASTPQERRVLLLRPGGDGYSFYERLRDEYSPPTTPIVDLLDVPLPSDLTET